MHHYFLSALLLISFAANAFQPSPQHSGQTGWTGLKGWELDGIDKLEGGPSFNPQDITQKVVTYDGNKLSFYAYIFVGNHVHMYQSRIPTTVKSFSFVSSQYVMSDLK